MDLPDQEHGVTEKPSIRLKFKDSALALAGPTAQTPKPPKPKAPTVGSESLVVKCGHTIAFDLYAKDTFRDQRREKAASRDCFECRQARVQAEMRKHEARRAKKAATFAKTLKPRLPDGSRFVATYDAAQVQWTGTLMVEGATFERSGSSLNKLLHKLDDVYRATLNEAVRAPESAAGSQEPSVAAP